MDKPLSPGERLADAVTGLARRLEQLRDALDVLACDITIAEVRQQRESQDREYESAATQQGHRSDCDGGGPSRAGRAPPP
jgi:hypothetical protein